MKWRLAGPIIPLKCPSKCQSEFARPITFARGKRILVPTPGQIDQGAALKPRPQMNKQTVALMALALFALTSDIANATTYEDIAGQWCGDVTDYVFAPNTLTVKFHDNRPNNVFKITKYTYTNNSVRIDWLNR